MKCPTTTATSTGNTIQMIDFFQHKNQKVRWLRYGILILVALNVLFNIRSTIQKNRNLKYVTLLSRQNVHYYHFPSQPLHNINSILTESIGTTIINDPQQNPLRNCSPTVQYRLIILQSEVSLTTDAFTTDDTSDTWILQSMMMLMTETSNNSSYNSNSNDSTTAMQVVPKLYGGDEIYVQWEADRNNNTNNDDDNWNHDYMGIAQVTDRQDGTYSLKFIRPPMLQFNYTKNQQQQQGIIVNHDGDKSFRTQQQQYGRLTIYYEYTCGIGSIFAPKKDKYTRGGEVYLTLTTADTAVPSSSTPDPEATTILVPRPYIHDFIPPNTIDATSSSSAATTNKQIDLSKYDTVFAFGDSLIMQLVRRYIGKGLWSKNIMWDKNVFQCLSTDNDARNMINKFHLQHGTQIRNLTEQSKPIALLTGTSSWDAMRGCVHEDMKDHVNAIRTFIQNVTKSFPNLDIYWKAPSALFLHRYTTYIEAFDDANFRKLKPKFGVKPLKPHYINAHVPQQLYRVQKELMKQEFHIPFLDLYESYYLSAPWTVQGDARHFQDAFTRLQLSYYWPGLLNKPIYV